jgi:ribosomal protein S18 acetylase RimI-like enzyme
MNGISIRPVRPDDVPVIAALLEQLARQYITAEFSLSAEEKFLRSNDEASIRAFIASGFEYWVAERCDAIIGFLGVRNHSHLYHLFVAESEQNRGVARALWNTAERACRVAGNPGSTPWCSKMLVNNRMHATCETHARDGWCWAK